MKTLVVVLGPTGVGKTELCLTIAEHLGIDTSMPTRVRYLQSCLSEQLLRPKNNNSVFIIILLAIITLMIITAPLSMKKR